MHSKTLKPEIMRTMLPAGFPADRLSKPQYTTIVQRDVMIPMRDGTLIAANIYRPDAGAESSAARTFPALHAADSYQKDLDHLPLVPMFHMRETNDIDFFVSRGYVFVHTDSRGTGHSPTGQWDMFGQEMQNDLYDMTEWIAVQPWCDGNVGMLGESLLAWSQWFCAVQQPPSLKCILPWDAGADLYRDVAFHGGIMSVGFPTAWNMWEIRGHYRLGAPDRFGTPPANPEMGRWDMVWNVINHPTHDDFWKLRNPDFKKIKVPVFVVGALHKVGLHLRGVVRGYEELETPKKMMLVHGLIDGDEMAIYNSPEMQLLMLRWYDHWLKGNDTGMMDEPPVEIFVRGANEYRLVDDWPLPNTDYRKLYFNAAKSGAVESLNDGSLSWEALRRTRRAVRAALSATPIPTGLDALLGRRHRRHRGERRHLRAAPHPHLHERTTRRRPADRGQHRAGALRLVRPAEHRLLRAPGRPVARRPAGAGHAAPGHHPHPRLAQGLARLHQERGALEAPSAVLPARQAPADRAGHDLQVRDRDLVDEQRVQEGPSHPHRRGLRRFAAARFRRPLLRHQGGHRHVLP